MILDNHYAVCFRIHVFFEASQENMNGDRPTLLPAKTVFVDSSFWQYKVYADIRRHSLERGRQIN